MFVKLDVLKSFTSPSNHAENDSYISSSITCWSHFWFQDISAIQTDKWSILWKNKQSYLVLHFVLQHLTAATLFCMIFPLLKLNRNFRGCHTTTILTKVLLDWSMKCSQSTPNNIWHLQFWPVARLGSHNLLDSSCCVGCLQTHRLKDGVFTKTPGMPVSGLSL